MLCDVEVRSKTVGLGSLLVLPTEPTPTKAGDAKHPQLKRPQRDRVDSELLAGPCKRDPSLRRTKRQGVQRPSVPSSTHIVPK